jgi:NAD(P)-dependent dehydrogenase (short-subunit alcohol dehydrogenase family)
VEGVNDPVALVVGASRGIGRSTCIDLAAHGFDVAVASRTGVDGPPAPGTVREVVGRVEQLGRRGLGLELDAHDLDAIRRGVARTLEELARIDVLVISANHIDFTAGGTYTSEFVDMRWDAIEAHIRLVGLGHLLLIHSVLPAMIRQRRGLIVSITQNQKSTRRPPQLPMTLEPPLMERLTEAVFRSPGEGHGAAMVPIARGLTERIAPALHRELAPHNVAIVTLDPSMTLSDPDPRRFAEAERSGFDLSTAHSVAVPARATTYLATCHNPMVFSGQFILAEDLVRTFGLMTEDEIYCGPGHDDEIGSLPRLNTVET